MKLRRFVNAVAPERSEKAFAALRRSLTRQGDDPRMVAERQVAFAVLASGMPAPEGGATPVPYTPLTLEQVARYQAAVADSGAHRP